MMLLSRWWFSSVFFQMLDWWPPGPLYFFFFYLSLSHTFPSPDFVNVRFQSSDSWFIPPFFPCSRFIQRAPCLSTPEPTERTRDGHNAKFFVNHDLLAVLPQTGAYNKLRSKLSFLFRPVSSLNLNSNFWSCPFAWYSCFSQDELKSYA